MNEELRNTILDLWQTGTSIETLEVQYPNHAVAIRSMLEQLQALRSATPPPLHPKAALAHSEFLKVAAQKRQALTQQPQAKPQPRSWWTKHWVWAVASVVMLTILLGGIVLTVSSNALPGDSLYSVKLWSESVNLNFTSSEQKVPTLIDYLALRNSELQALIKQKRSIPISLINDIQTSTLTIGNELKSHPNPANLQRLADVTEDVISTLKDVETSDPALQKAVNTAITQVETTQKQNQDQLVDQGPATVTPTATSTAIPTATPTSTHSPTATSTDRPTATATATATSTDTPTVTNTPRPSPIHPTSKPHPTHPIVPPTTRPTRVPTVRPTQIVPTATSDITPTQTLEPTATDWPTESPTDVPTDVIGVPTDSPTNTVPPMITATPTATVRPTNDVPATAKPPTKTPKP